VNDDRYRIQIDRDRDGTPDEVIDNHRVSSDATEEPATIHLPPRHVQTHPVAPGIHVADDPVGTSERRDPPVLPFALAVVGVVFLAALIAVVASRLVGALNVGDDAATLVGMFVGVGCAVGAFLVIARMTRMLGLQPQPVASADPRRAILASAHIDVGFRSALEDALGVDARGEGPVMLDLVAVSDAGDVALQLLGDDGQVASETPFRSRDDAYAYADRTYGVRRSDWTELR
jgi:hypothetical protein